MPRKTLLAGLAGAMVLAGSANATTTGWGYGGYQFGGSYGSYGGSHEGSYGGSWSGFGGYDGGWSGSGGHDGMFDMTRGDWGGSYGDHDDAESLFDTFQRLCRSFYIGDKDGDKDDGWHKDPVYPPSEVPLPAAGFLLVAGLGGMAALKRRAR